MPDNLHDSRFGSTRTKLCLSAYHITCGNYLYVATTFIYLTELKALSSKINVNSYNITIKKFIFLTVHNVEWSDYLTFQIDECQI